MSRGGNAREEYRNKRVSLPIFALLGGIFDLNSRLVELPVSEGSREKSAHKRRDRQRAFFFFSSSRKITDTSDVTKLSMELPIPRYAVRSPLLSFTSSSRPSRRMDYYRID